MYYIVFCSNIYIYILYLVNKIVWGQFTASLPSMWPLLFDWLIDWFIDWLITDIAAITHMRGLACAIQECWRSPISSRYYRSTINHLRFAVNRLLYQTMDHFHFFDESFAESKHSQAARSKLLYLRVLKYVLFKLIISIGPYT